jgi:serine/threonine protein kinase
MEHFHEDLYSMNARKKIKPQLIQIYMYQIFKGLEYLANNNIAHRDLKPHNILINKITNKAVICDFGSAKKIKNG